MNRWIYYLDTEKGKVKDENELFNSIDPSPVSSQGHKITVINVLAQASTAVSQHINREVNTGMGYSVQNKPLPQNIDIDLINKTLTTGEKEEVLKDIVLSAITVVKTGKSEYIDALRQVLVAWESTIIVKSDHEFVLKLEEIREEVKKDPTPGIAWKELLRR